MIDILQLIWLIVGLLIIVAIGASLGLALFFWLTRER